MVDDEGAKMSWRTTGMFLLSKPIRQRQSTNLQIRLDKSSAMAVLESSAVSKPGDWWYMPDRAWIDNWANPLNQKVRYGTLTFDDYIYGYTEVSNRALKAYKE